MAKRIDILILSTAVIVFGIIAFNRLHYWERSVRIFSMSKGQSIERGLDRHRGDFDGRARPGRLESSGNPFDRQNFRNLPDSVRQRILAERRAAMSSDNLHAFPAERENFRNLSFERDGRHGRGDFLRGNQIQLANVSWFLAVFALFIVVTIYLEKAHKLIQSKRQEPIRPTNKTNFQNE
jgi:hypothetical protein